MKFISSLSAVLLVLTPFAAMAEDTATPVAATDAANAPAPVVAEEITAVEPTVVEEAKIVEPVVVEDVKVVESVAAPVVAEEVTKLSSWYDGIELGVGVSATSGLNGFVGYANKESSWWLMRRLGLRLDFASTKPIKSWIDSGADSLIGDEGYDIEDVTIKDVDIKAQHAAALLDLYPFGDTWFLGGWRISGGYFLGDINVKAGLTGAVEGLPAGEFGFSFGDTQYKYTGNNVRGTAEIDWDYSGPYVGTGFDLGLFAGFKIYVDAGVVFTNNTAKADLLVPFDNLQQKVGDNWETVKGNAGLEAQVNTEKAKALADVQKELDKLDFYPMVKVGFMYRF